MFKSILFAQMTALSAPEATAPAALDLVIPYSWLEECHRHRNGGCRVNSMKPIDLAYINQLVWQTLEDEPDSDPLDDWEAFPLDRKGDCDNHTMTVRAAYYELGIPYSDMRVELGTVTMMDGSKRDHAVLVVNLNGTEWVVDRMTHDRVYRIDSRPFVWESIAVQPRDGVVWPQELEPEPTRSPGFVLAPRARGAARAIESDELGPVS